MALHERWEQEKVLAQEITDTRTKIESPEDTADKDALREILTATSAKLRTLQGEEPLIYPVVDGVAVSEESSPAGPASPWGGCDRSRSRTVLNLRDAMEKRIVGQSHAAASGRSGDPDQPCRIDRSAQADRGVPDGRNLRHRQDRNRAHVR